MGDCGHGRRIADSMGNRYPWDEAAQVYEEVRPSYPDQLVQDIIDGANLSGNERLLEIGAGTGKATAMFAKRGFQIHCVEPGPNLAGILADKLSYYPNVNVDVASFEDWTPRESTEYDLIFCAQAFEYIDPEIRYRKCHQLLKKDGHLALFWYGHYDEAWESDIAVSGLFGDPKVFDYHSELISSTETCVKALESTSSFVVLDEESKSRMREETRRNVEKQGGSVKVKLNYRMYLARKI